MMTYCYFDSRSRELYETCLDSYGLVIELHATIPSRYTYNGSSSNDERCGAGLESCIDRTRCQPLRNWQRAADCRIDRQLLLAPVVVVVVNTTLLAVVCAY
jgi:hypothetical protein